MNFEDVSYRLDTYFLLQLSPSGGYIPGIYTKIEQYIPWILRNLEP